LLQDVIASIFESAVVLENSCLTLSAPQSEVVFIEEVVSKFVRSVGERLDFCIKTSQKRNQNWVQEYQKNIPPILIEPFFIHTSWHTPKKNKINIQIDPNMAFGTGNHQTTSSCLELISKMPLENKNCLDLGCGTGILALAMRYKKANVDFCDTDEKAIKIAKKNFQINKLDFGECWCGSLKSSPDNTYDLIVANLVSDILISLKDSFWENLKEECYLIISGILIDYKEKILDAFSKKYNLLEEIEKQNWVTFLLRKKKNG